MSVCNEPTPSADEHAASTPAASPARRPHVPDPFLDSAPPTGDNSKAVITLLAAVGAGTLLMAAGLIMSRVGDSGRAHEPAPMTTTLSEQHKMMREAVQMARDANEMQRERMELMRREMERGERGGAGETPAAAGGEFVGD